MFDIISQLKYKEQTGDNIENKMRDYIKNL